MGDSRVQRAACYVKTAKGWDVLARPGVVGRHAHSLLLLANGRRSAGELSLLLGDDVSALAHHLHAEGYLQHAGASAQGVAAEDLP
ncbi:hypothetical protein [Hydrogenophaga sp.]|uniref:hypothetical protein n=1 Tax=Hydrogenophaga sp. TaxID=1904254 RepID=UPI0019B7765A|nr:hypothetical protein [Hydrogenophaga sp.]MBD3892521.1 hypothetical protein [Hydrogenophaga sp.]